MKPKRKTPLIIIIFLLALAGSINAQVDKTISLNAKDTDIRILLTNIAETNGINLVIAGSVTGKVTIGLDDVSPIEAMELILIAGGYGMDEIGNSIIVGKPEEIRGYIPIEIPEKS